MGAMMFKSNGWSSLFILLVLCFINHIENNTAASSRFTNATDRQALLAIKDQISGDPFNSLRSWNSSSSLHFCNWQGVTCGRGHQRVTALNLSSLQLSGSLSPHIGNLSGLRALYLNENHLQGSIPAELGQLSILQSLQLSVNNFSGMVPEQLYNISSLRFLSTTDNQLYGSLPLDLGSKLPNLQILYLAMNQFVGPIPTSIAKMSRLEMVDLGQNALTGPVPNLGNLQNLRYINLGSNPLGDDDLTFLTSLTNCTNLGLINLFENRLTGALPDSIANLSTNLYWLALWDNNITGVIPDGIGNLKNLQYLALDGNELTSRIPESIGKLSNLKEFYAYHNRISGEIPPSLGNISGLLGLSIGENLLEGSIPASLANCIHLEALEVTQNNLSGVIPEKIFGLSSLTIGLFLGSNKFTGPLPSQLGNMKNLIELDASENKLSGEIPSTLDNLHMLETLRLNGNFFDGAIPSGLKNLRSIQVLDLSRNNLSGQIAVFFGELPLLENLNLSFNKFEGQVPTEGIFKNATAFSVAGNNLLCGGIDAIHLPPCLKIRQKNIISRKVVILISSVAALFILLLLSCMFVALYRNQLTKRKPFSVSFLEKKHKTVSYGDLVHATDGFSSANIIGDGRYGTVYKGILRSDDQVVAVKVMKLQQKGTNKTFVAECEALRCIRHRNLVSIFTACSTIDFKGNDFKALIFEFMPNGSLESWLHPSSEELQDSKELSLLQRLNILIDVASALDYLHNHCEKPVVHCDLKPGNILLDNDLIAHVGDFGLAKILSAGTGGSVPSSTSSLGIRGTIGYVPPEYGLEGEVSIHGDAYSYGILVLEMFTGKRPTDIMFVVEFSLHNFVKAALPDQVWEIVDPLLTFGIQEAGQSNRTGPSSIREGNIGKIEACLVSIFQVGVLCSAASPRERMVIVDALRELNKVRKFLCSP